MLAGFLVQMQMLLEVSIFQWWAENTSPVVAEVSNGDFEVKGDGRVACFADTDGRIVVDIICGGGSLTAGT